MGEYSPKKFLHSAEFSLIFFCQKINTFCTRIGAFGRLFTPGCRLLYCFLLGRVLCSAVLLYPGYWLLRGPSHHVWCLWWCDVSRSDCVTPPLSPDMNSITQIKCHNSQGWRSRKVDRLSNSHSLHPSHNQPVFTVNLSTNSPLSRPWSEKNTERIVPFSLTVFPWF